MQKERTRKVRSFFVSGKVGALLFQPQFPQHILAEILGLPCRSDNAIGHRFFEFGLSCTSLLRDREVFLKSVGATDGDGATDADQFSRSRVEGFFILEADNILASLHNTSLSSEAKWSDRCFSPHLATAVSEV